MRYILLIQLLASFFFTPLGGHSMEHVAHINQNEVKISHIVKGNNVYIECIVPGFSFLSKNEKSEDVTTGNLHVYIDGKKVNEVNQSAFIIKGPSIGQHEVMLKFVKTDDSVYYETESFTVHIDAS